MDVVHDVTTSDGNVRITVKTDEERASREGVALVEGVSNKTRGVDGGAALKGRAGLDVVVERGVVVVVVVGSARSPRLGFWFGFSFLCCPLMYCPTLCNRWGRDVERAISPLMRRVWVR
jgi:hypothetical protein